MDEIIEDELRELLDYAYLSVGVIGASSVVMEQESGTAILVTRDGSGLRYVWNETPPGDLATVVENRIIIRSSFRVAVPSLCVVIYPDGRIVRGRETADHIQMEDDIAKIYNETIAQKYADMLMAMVQGESSEDHNRPRPLG